MKSYYIPHKITVGEIHHLSDTDSEIIIKQGEIKSDDMINVSAPNGFFKAIVEYIDKASVEVEIVKLVSKAEKISTPTQIQLLQSMCHQVKFTFLLEKCVEIGINGIIPFESEYTVTKHKEFTKSRGLYRKVIADAIEQSRHTGGFELEDSVSLKNLKDGELNEVRLAFVTESLADSAHLNQYKDEIMSKSVSIAIGPEKGWSFEDLEILRRLRFKFVYLEGNILRTETAGIVASSIIKFIKGDM